MSGDVGIRFHLFGPVRVEVRGRVVRLEDDQRLLLAVLVLQRNAPLSVTDLRHALWGGRPPHRADAEARRLVGELAVDLAREGAPRLQEVPAGWVLRAEDHEVDLAQFQGLQQRAAVCVAEGRHDLAVPLQRQAVELAMPGVLVGVDGSLVAGHRKVIGRRVRAVTLAHADSCLVLRRGGEVVAWFEALTRAFPEDLAYTERLVDALLQAGRPDDAGRVADRAEVHARPADAGRVGALRTRTDDARGGHVARARARAAALPVRLEVLGEVRMSRGSTTVPVEDAATRALLAALLLRQGRPLDESELARVLDDGGGPAPRGVVLDQLVAVDALVGPGLRVTRTDAGWVLEVAAPHQLDLAAVRALEQRGRSLLARGDHEGAAAVRQSVRAAVRERPLRGLRGPWFEAERARLVAWRAGVLADLDDAAEAVRFCVLDDLVVRRGQQRVRLGSDRMVRALTVLLLRSGTPVEDDELRRAVGGDDAWVRLPGPDVTEWVAEITDVVGASAYIVRTGTATTLQVVRPHRLDLAEALELVARGRAEHAAGSPAAAAATFDAALGLLPARPRLPEGRWFADETRRLRELRADVLDERRAAWDAAWAQQVGAAGPAGDGGAPVPPSVVEDLETRVAAEPLREDHWEAYLTALHDAGRTAEALAEYDRMTHLLRQWLGTPPGPALQMLRRRLGD